jgi:chemotaxis protein MotB
MGSEQTGSGSSKDGFLEPTYFPAGAAKSRYASRIINVERRSRANTVFQVDDNIFPTNLPRPSHWSVAWSDLMMTMFVLFLSMYVYQAANEEFLHQGKPEVLGGDTTEALQTVDSSGASFPFAPIHPGLPLVTGGTIKKVEKVEIDTIDPEGAYPVEETAPPAIDDIEPVEDIPAPLSAKNEVVEPDKIALIVAIEKEIGAQVTAPVTPSPSEDVLQPRPIVLEDPSPPVTDNFQEIYTLSKGALAKNHLDKFAAIDIVPDKTMRIILTGDLLFDLGEAELSGDARNSLQKITSVMRHTPYMINIVGHTDNVPMRSSNFKSNWDLSLARASTVARFLIDDTGMDPNQFVVSGYSSYRPIAPNTTADNRAKNRRVEIIISKRLPNPLPATTENLN